MMENDESNHREINEEQKDSDENTTKQIPETTVPVNVDEYVHSPFSKDNVRKKDLEHNVGKEKPCQLRNSGNNAGRPSRARKHKVSKKMVYTCRSYTKMTRNKPRKPGRPAQAGPSKKYRYNVLSNLYWGKLKNVTLKREMKRTRKKKRTAGRKPTKATPNH